MNPLPQYTQIRRVKRLAATLLLSGSVAVAALAGTPTAASAQPSTTAGATKSAAAGDFGYFTGNGVRIWSRPGSGTVLGLGYRNQGFCADSRRGSYFHGRNTKTGVTGWVSASYVHIAMALEC